MWRSEALQKRLAKFVLERLLGPYLVEELNIEQLQLDLSSGRLELKDLHLDVKVLNKQILGTPFLVKSGHIGSAQVTVPWRDLLGGHVRMHLAGLDVCVVPRAQADPDLYGGESSQLSSSHDDDLAQGGWWPWVWGEGAEGRPEGLAMLKRVAETVLAKIQASAENCSVRAEFHDESTNQTRTLILKVDRVDYADTTPSPTTNASTNDTIPCDDVSGAKGIPGIPQTAVYAQAAVSVKDVKVSGMALRVDTGDQISPVAVACTGDKGCWGQLKLHWNQTPLGSGPEPPTRPSKVEIELFTRDFHAVLSPETVDVLESFKEVFVPEATGDFGGLESVQGGGYGNGGKSVYFSMEPGGTSVMMLSQQGPLTRSLTAEEYDLIEQLYQDYKATAGGKTQTPQFARFNPPAAVSTPRSPFQSHHQPPREKMGGFGGGLGDVDSDLDDFSLDSDSEGSDLDDSSMFHPLDSVPTEGVETTGAEEKVASCTTEIVLKAHLPSSSIVCLYDKPANPASLLPKIETYFSYLSLHGVTPAPTAPTTKRAATFLECNHLVVGLNQALVKFQGVLDTMKMGGNLSLGSVHATVRVMESWANEVLFETQPPNSSETGSGFIPSRANVPTIRPIVHFVEGLGFGEEYSDAWAPVESARRNDGVRGRGQKEGEKERLHHHPMIKVVVGSDTASFDKRSKTSGIPVTVQMQPMVVEADYAILDRLVDFLDRSRNNDPGQKGSRPPDSQTKTPLPTPSFTVEWSLVRLATRIPHPLPPQEFTHETEPNPNENTENTPGNPANQNTENDALTNPEFEKLMKGPRSTYEDIVLFDFANVKLGQTRVLSPLVEDVTNISFEKASVGVYFHDPQSVALGGTVGLWGDDMGRRAGEGGRQVRILTVRGFGSKTPEIVVRIRRDEEQCRTVVSRRSGLGNGDVGPAFAVSLPLGTPSPFSPVFTSFEGDHVRQRCLTSAEPKDFIRFRNAAESSSRVCVECILPHVQGVATKAHYDRVYVLLDALGMWQPLLALRGKTSQSEAVFEVCQSTDSESESEVDRDNYYAPGKSRHKDAKPSRTREHVLKPSSLCVKLTAARVELSLEEDTTSAVRLKEKREMQKRNSELRQKFAAAAANAKEENEKEKMGEAARGQPETEGTEDDEEEDIPDIDDVSYGDEEADTTATHEEAGSTEGNLRRFNISQDVSLSERIGPCSDCFEVISRSRLGEPTESKAPMLVVVCRMDTDKVRLSRTLTVCVDLTHCQLEHRVTATPLDSWLLHLLDVADVPATIYPGVVCMQWLHSVYVNVRHSAISYQPLYDPSAAVISIGCLHMTTNTVPHATSLLLQFLIRQAALYIINRPPSPVVPLQAITGSWAEHERQTLEGQGYIKVAAMDWLELLVRINDRPDAPGPGLEVEVSNQSLEVNVCMDSCEALTHLLSYYADGLDLPAKTDNGAMDYNPDGDEAYAQDVHLVGTSPMQGNQDLWASLQQEIFRVPPSPPTRNLPQSNYHETPQPQQQAHHHQPPPPSNTRSLSSHMGGSSPLPVPPKPSPTYSSSPWGNVADSIGRSESPLIDFGLEESVRTPSKKRGAQKPLGSVRYVEEDYDEGGFNVDFGADLAELESRGKERSVERAKGRERERWEAERDWVMSSSPAVNDSEGGYDKVQSDLGTERMQRLISDSIMIDTLNDQYQRPQPAPPQTNRNQAHSSRPPTTTIFGAAVSDGHWASVGQDEVGGSARWQAHGDDHDLLGFGSDLSDEEGDWGLPSATRHTHQPAHSILQPTRPNADDDWVDGLGEQNTSGALIDPNEEDFWRPRPHPHPHQPPRQHPPPTLRGGGHHAQTPPNPYFIDPSIPMDAPPDMYSDGEEVPGIPQMPDDCVRVLDGGDWVVEQNHFDVPPAATAAYLKLPSHYPPAIERILLRDVNATVNMYGGYDWAIDGVGRNTDELVRLNVYRATFELLEFPKATQAAWRLLVHVWDVELLDRLVASQWNKMACYWRRDTHLRPEGSAMIHAELLGVRPNLERRDEECRARFSLLPLRFNIDQDALLSLLRFFSYRPPPRMPSAHNTNGLRKHGSVGSTCSLSRGGPFSKEGVFFQHVVVGPVVFRVDYRAKHLDLHQLRNGNLAELLNLFHLEGAAVDLNEVTIVGVHGFGRLGDAVLEAWLPHIRRTQIPKVVRGIMPLRSVANVGSGVADLVLLPLEQYRRDQRLLHGIKKGTFSFIRNVSVETVDLGARLAVNAQTVLELVDDFITPSQISSPGGGDTLGEMSSLPGISSFNVSPYATSNFNNVLGARSESPLPPAAGVLSAEGTPRGQQKSFLGGADVGFEPSKYANQPATITEGLYDAFSSLSREVNTAVTTIVLVPLAEYERTGARGAARSVIRAVPVAVLRPMIGASQAAAKTLQGIRNTVDPEARYDIQDKYKRSLD